MRYLDAINNCKRKVDNQFKEFALTLKNSEFFSKLHSTLSSHSFVNGFQLVDSVLSFYIPELENSDENGIDISIGLFQIREMKNEVTSYRSEIKYDENGDLIVDKFLYVTSDVCTTSGTFILQNPDKVIRIHDADSLDKELAKTIDTIAVAFSSNVELMSTKLLDLKNCA